MKITPQLRFVQLQSEQAACEEEGLKQTRCSIAFVMAMPFCMTVQKYASGE